MAHGDTKRRVSMHAEHIKSIAQCMIIVHGRLGVAEEEVNKLKLEVADLKRKMLGEEHDDQR